MALRLLQNLTVTGTEFLRMCNLNIFATTVSKIRKYSDVNPLNDNELNDFPSMSQITSVTIYRSVTAKGHEQLSYSKIIIMYRDPILLNMNL